MCLCVCTCIHTHTAWSVTVNSFTSLNNVEEKSNTFSSPVAKIIADTPLTKDRLTKEKQNHTI